MRGRVVLQVTRRLWRLDDIVVATSPPATSTGAFTTSESERQPSIGVKTRLPLWGEVVAEERVTVLMRDTTGSFVVRRRLPSARSLFFCAPICCGRCSQKDGEKGSGVVLMDWAR